VWTSRSRRSDGSRRIADFQMPISDWLLGEAVSVHTKNAVSKLEIPIGNRQAAIGN
jgi:hypothetical protein